MERAPARAAALLLLATAALLLGPRPARADGDFDGKRTMNANGWTFVLELHQNGDAVTGSMTGINNDGKSTVEGKINGKEIRFTRDNGQEYKGYLFVDDPAGRGSKLGMAGTAKAGDDPFGWFATR
jgi:hypothetical protein